MLSGHRHSFREYLEVIAASRPDGAPTSESHRLRRRSMSITPEIGDDIVRAVRAMNETLKQEHLFKDDVEDRSHSTHGKDESLFAQLLCAFILKSCIFLCLFTMNYFNLKGCYRNSHEISFFNFFPSSQHVKIYKRQFGTEAPDKKITISAFTNPLLIDGRVKENLVLNKPLTLEDMIEKVNNFIDLERLTTKKPKPQRITLPTKCHPEERAHNNNKDYGGDKKRFKSNDNQGRQGQRKPIPCIPQLKTTLANLYALIQKDEFFRNANTLSPIPEKPFYIHYQIQHHDMEWCFTLIFLL
ncbi:hypothetical protein GIB67_011936 [Kingdonia uniflora]|uniref:Uncharacterized protein n=1 Tax=Kingdonia uniflora TaxID=39325 RepID=A0A7J7LZU5_9MAGN|nr:hypothetical protein GIB67_011936 [Kingdonia uniflora]